MRDQLVTETIDARILRLVGLEDVFDLDYETYLVLLKEAQVRGKNTLPAEEQAILANERKRVRGKVGRFKPKAKTINVNSITSVGRVGQKLLPGARGIGSAPIVKSLASIGAIVESISENLSDQSKEDKKEAEENRKSEENARRKKKEESLESSAKKVMAAAKKLFAPVRGIFDAIYNYLFYTFLGRGINEALTWLADPKNKTKVAAIGQFIKDFWPALLGAATYFFTPLRGFINGIVGLVVRLGKFFIRGPKGLDPVSLGVGTAVSTFEAERRRQQEEKRLSEEEAKKRGIKPETVQKELKESKKSWWSMFGQGFSDVGLSVGGIASGGFIDQNTGLRISGAGADTQLTALQPGEVVMNRAAVRAVGANNLLNLNRMFGGPNANKPRFSNNIQLAQGGGLIGKALNWWNKGRNVRIPRESRASWFDLMRDDLKQRGQSDVNFAKGAKPSIFGRPDRGVFSRDFLDWDRSKSKRNPLGIPRPRYVPAEKGGTGSAPTPAVRQIFERIPQYSIAFDMGVKLYNMMEKRNAAVRSKQYGYGTVEDMMVAPERYAKLSSSSPRTPGLMPVSKSKANVITLPPTVENAPSTMPQKSGGSEVPSFSATAPGNRRMENAQIYGIVQ